MIPNLTLIIAAYCAVRLVEMSARQWPSLRGRAGLAYLVTVLSTLAVALIVLCTLDTLGTGFRIGSLIDDATSHRR